MTKAEMKTYLAVLEGLRERLTGRMAGLADEATKSASNAADQQPGEDGANSIDTEFTFSLLATQERALEEVDSALARIRAGTFGQCEECAGPIHKARLQTLPHTRHCVACARKLQQSS